MIKYKTSAGILGICFVMILFIWSNVVAYSAQKKVMQYTELTNGWDIEGDVQATDATIDQVVFEHMDKGSQVSTTTVLPDVAIVNPVLRIYTIHAAFQVYLEQELIYEYGLDRMEQGKMLGYGYQLIDLPKDFAGKKLKIDYYVTEDRAFGDMKVPGICNGVDAVKRMAMETSVAIGINMFLFIFGIALIIASLIFTLQHHSFFKLLCMGAFSMGIAVWSFCYYDAIYLFANDPLVKVYAEFSAVYIAPIPFILYFYEDIQTKANRILKVMYRVILVAQVTFTLLAFGLHMTNLVHLPKMIFVEHIILVILIVYMIWVSIYELRSKIFTHQILFIGMSLMLCTGLWDIVRHNLHRYFGGFEPEHYVSILCVGALVFVFAQILDFVSEISRTLCESVQTETLEKMAYSDFLTGIANRRKCEEELEKLETTQENYGIFSFDLNNLKLTNDTLGHAKGDEMICRFAEILQEIFADTAIVGRMGGDEFIAIVPNADEIDTDKVIQQLQRKVMEERTQKNPLDLSTAYGYCEKKEYRDVDVKGIYRKADARMYDMKIEMKYRKKEYI